MYYTIYTIERVLDPILPWGEVPPIPTRNSQPPAEYPTIHLNSNTIPVGVRASPPPDARRSGTGLTQFSVPRAWLLSDT